MKIAVLMACYNRVETTLRCLSSLFSQLLPTGASLEVFLVDDASPDKTGEVVKKAYPQVHVILSNGGLYWCKGMRLAWEEAAKAGQWDYFLWLNDDVLIHKGAIASILQDAQSVNDNGVVVGTMASDDGFQHLCYGCYNDSGVLRPNGQPQLASNHLMSGNMVLIPAAVFNCAGFIYGGYSHAYGDTDYRMILKRHGIPLYCGSNICGICPEEPGRYLKFAELSLCERLKLLRNPKGIPIKDVFIFRMRHWGLMRALFSVSHVFFNALVGRDARR